MESKPVSVTAQRANKSGQWSLTIDMTMVVNTARLECGTILSQPIPDFQTAFYTAQAARNELFDLLQKKWRR